jgi:hypothetical protein
MNSIIKPVIKSLREIHCASCWLLNTVGAKVLSVCCTVCYLGAISRTSRSLSVNGV